LDNIQIGLGGSTINISYDYDLAGNRTGSTLTVMTLDNDDIAENRTDESNPIEIDDTFEFNLFPNPANT